MDSKSNFFFWLIQKSWAKKLAIMGIVRTTPEKLQGPVVNVKGIKQPPSGCDNPSQKATQKNSSAEIRGPKEALRYKCGHGPF